MKIELKNIKIAELADGYKDSGDNGVVGFGGKLNIRPAFQREFVYKEKQRNEVIQTVRKNFPLNTMYWAVTDDGYELLDGQQRTVSICRFVNGDFSVEIDKTPLYFHNLTADKKQQILDYELSIYVCEGTPSEKLDWFKIINIAGEKLTDQELRNAIYTGPWLTDAKAWFSKNNCPAAQIGEGLVTGSPIRQELLETTLEWISGDKVEDYMASHQHDPDAQELWMYYQAVIAWVKRVFPKWRKEMKGLAWGEFYNEFKDKPFNAATLEERISQLYLDDEVTNKRGIYPYLLSGSERFLTLRTFDERTKATVYEKQAGICPICKEFFYASAMEADHIDPWSKGGKTVESNCQMLCLPCNRRKSAK